MSEPTDNVPQPESVEAVDKGESPADGSRCENRAATDASSAPEDDAWAGTLGDVASHPAAGLAAEVADEVPGQPNDGDHEPETEAPSSPDLLERCERRIRHSFANKSLLREALTHASGAEHRLASNERLEFLGDAILGAIVCELLFEQYPHYLEGDLTKIKSVVVSRHTCAKISEALGLQEFLIVGKGMATGQAIPPSLLADVFESLVAAVHLDGGPQAARRFIEEFLGPEIELVATGELGGNYKSLLQQVAQRESCLTPLYELLDEKGPDHRKCFKVAARVGTVRYPAAWGRNKKEAEQRAACNALAELNGEPPQFPSD